MQISSEVMSTVDSVDCWQIWFCHFRK